MVNFSPLVIITVHAFMMSRPAKKFSTHTHTHRKRKKEKESERECVCSGSDREQGEMFAEVDH
jgi:hypothetical protein